MQTIRRCLPPENVEFLASCVEDAVCILPLRESTSARAAAVDRVLYRDDRFRGRRGKRREHRWVQHRMLNMQ